MKIAATAPVRKMIGYLQKRKNARVPGKYKPVLPELIKGDGEVIEFRFGNPVFPYDLQLLSGHDNTLRWYRSTDNWIRLELRGDFKALYGLGEKSDGLNKINKKYVMWNTDNSEFKSDSDPLYKSIPFAILLGDRPIGVIMHYPGYQIWKSTSTELLIDVADVNLQCFIIKGSIPKILRKYIEITGSPFIPPLWALGYHQCRWSYSPQSRVIEVAQGFMKHNIPCDAIWIDIDYMDGYRCFTWDPRKFPNPRGMIASLREQGIRTVTMIDPGIKVDEDYPVYLEGNKNDRFVTINGKEYHDPVWAGDSAFPDFIDEEVMGWWGSFYESQIGLGVEAFWNDMNEPSIFTILRTMPRNIEHRYQGKIMMHEHIHNIYGSKMAEASYKGIAQWQSNPFVLSRSAYLGIQQFAWTWTGDNESSWEHLKLSIPKCIGMGLSGLLTGADIGGFRGAPTPELFARWIQLGAFYPFMRVHTTNGSPDQEPWSFGSEVMEITRDAIRLRYKLIFYIITHVYLHKYTGIPLMRPMWLEFEDEECLLVEDTQFMFGPDLLIAPVLDEGDVKRKLYLPKGKWYDFDVHHEYQGGQFLEINAPMRKIPVFIRDNTILPLAKSVERNVENTLAMGYETREFGEKPKGVVFQDSLLINLPTREKITVEDYIKGQENL